MTKNKPSANEALKSELDAMAEWAAPGSDLTASIREITARNVLRGDLGLYSEHQIDYNFDDATRDRLIAHGRQDAAHTVIAASDILKQISTQRSFLLRLFVIAGCYALICIVLLGLILWRVW